MHNHPWKLPFGANVTADATSFRVWAPKAGRVVVQLSGGRSDSLALQEEGTGYFSGVFPGVSHGDRYAYQLDEQPARPDPVSRCQPEGVHAPSQVVDPQRYPWQDGAWRGLPLEAYVIYELHVGTFSSGGDFDSIIPALDYLKELGITAVEIMPVAQFPGNRNWGYDGVGLFAPHSGYGGPDGLKALVQACHARGMAVILDVVYNHLGPEGNYLESFGHYFTDRYRTPWGAAVNFDGPHCDPVREFVVANALYWISEYHVDSLRLDAVHGIFDFSARHILRELAEAVQHLREEQGRLCYLIAESDLNDTRVINSREIGGHGIDAQWNDDFHHALHTLLTGESSGYYGDFGTVEQMACAITQGFVYTGQYSPFRKRRFGSSSRDNPPTQFVVCSQNHDQVGNRAQGDRLSTGLPVAKLTLAAGMVLLSPNLPLIFMGEEYGETAPFQYFVSHSDPGLIEAVRRGRREEFAAFTGQGEAPDPQDEATFLRSKIRLSLRESGIHRAINNFYRELLRLRRTLPGLAATPDRSSLSVLSREDQRVIIVERGRGEQRVLCLYNFHEARQVVSVGTEAGSWQKIFDSAAREWGGPGADSLCFTQTEPGSASIAVQPFSLQILARRRCL